MDGEAKTKLAGPERRQLTRFYLIAFAWTWALWIPALVWSAQTGSPIPMIEGGTAAWRGLPPLSIAFASAFQLAVYGPLVAALFMLVADARAGKPAALRAWFGALTKSCVSWHWWAFVFGWPVALGALVVGIGSVAGGGAPRLTAAPALAAIPLLFATQLITSGLEEPGWRGYALPLLQKTHSAENASWYLGLAWAAWHLPFVIYLYREAPVWMLPLAIAGFTMSIIAMGYVHAWVYNSTGSLLPNIALHAWANVANTLAAAIQPSPVVPLVTAGITWLFVAWLLRRYGKQRLAVEPANANA